MSVRVGAFGDSLSSEFPPACRLAAGSGLDALAVRNVGGAVLPMGSNGSTPD